MRNVLIVCLDSVREDYFRVYASSLKERSSITVQNCRAASSWSTPSHASILTGKLAHQHGIHAHSPHFGSLPLEETFLAELTDARTIGVSTNPLVGPSYGFDVFFDEFQTVSPKARYPSGLDMSAFYERADDGMKKYLQLVSEILTHDRPTTSCLNAILATIDSYTEHSLIPKLFDDGATAAIRSAKHLIANQSSDWFMFMNLMEAHDPHRPILGFDRRLHTVSAGWHSTERSIWDLMGPEEATEYWQNWRSIYAAAIDYLDRKLTSFIDWILDHNPHTSIIITADHGENLGYPADEFLAYHRGSLSEGLLHVPLCIVNPPEGYEIYGDGYVSHLDLGEIITNIVTEGPSTSTTKRAAAERIGIGLASDPPDRYDYWDRLIRCVYDGTKKIEWDSLGQTRAFDLDMSRPCWQSTPSETSTVPSWCSDYFDSDIQTAKEKAKVERTDAIPASVRDRLEELGYL